MILAFEEFKLHVVQTAQNHCIIILVRKFIHYSFVLSENQDLHFTKLFPSSERAWAFSCTTSRSNQASRFQVINQGPSQTYQDRNALFHIDGRTNCNYGMITDYGYYS